MLSLLPDLTPRDSHSLWYTSSRNPFASNNSGGSSNDLRHTHGNYGAFPHQNGPYDRHHSPQGLHLNNNNNNHNNGPHHQHRRGGGPQHHHHHNHHLVVERSPLARLRADELNLERRRQNVSNFGSGWLKPPGIPKTLHQLREERREAEEHQEAMRREQLAQELAEAEVAGVAAAADAEGGDDMDDMLDGPDQGDEGEGGDRMDDVQLDGARDLDEDIPEGDADFGFGSEEEEEDEEEEEEDEDEGEDEGDRAAREQEQLMAQRMRSTHGGEAVYYGAEDEVDDEDQAHMIEEEDLLGGGRGGAGGQNDGTGDDGDLDMGADLDDDIPEAESAGYEHTDTEEELSSDGNNDDDDDDDDDGNDGDHAEMSFARAPQAATRFRNSLARSDVTRHSIAISDLLSRDGSSVAGSSPQVPGPRSSIGSSFHRGRGRGGRG
ncbi:hypothetical protein SLS62_010760 [Diatrype stigma]|uniref:Anaphase-promoting complex, subunit 15/MND2 n=1 Tax=Diatrype stigma TaxID=117547 RepID=A0AAN9U7Y7_9PEZI